MFSGTSPPRNDGGPERVSTLVKRISRKILGKEQGGDGEEEGRRESPHARTRVPFHGSLTSYVFSLAFTDVFQRPRPATGDAFKVA
jgi:hypothetical protein